MPDDIEGIGISFDKHYDLQISEDDIHWNLFMVNVLNVKVSLLTQSVSDVIDGESVMSEEDKKELQRLKDEINIIINTKIKNEVNVERNLSKLSEETLELYNIFHLVKKALSEKNNNMLYIIGSALSRHEILKDQVKSIYLISHRLNLKG